MTSDTIEGIIVIGIGFFLFWLYKANKKQKASRSDKFRKFAVKNAFIYSDTRDFSALDLPKDAWFSSWGTPVNVDYFLEWEENNVQIMAFEYTYTDNVTQRSNFCNRYLLSLRKPDMHFPWFRSCPEKEWQFSYPWWHKGWEQIHPGTNLASTTQNVIKSKYKNDVEQLLTPTVIDQLRWFDGLQIEAIHDYLFIVLKEIPDPDQELITMASKGILLINAIADAWQVSKEDDHLFVSI